MDNKDNIQHDDNCTLCQAYEMFKQMKQLNFDDGSAFHIAARQLIDITTDLIFGGGENDSGDTNQPADISAYLNLAQSDLSDNDETLYALGTEHGYEEAIDDIYNIIKAYKDSFEVMKDDEN